MLVTKIIAEITAAPANTYTRTEIIASTLWGSLEVAEGIYRLPLYGELSNETSGALAVASQEMRDGAVGTTYTDTIVASGGIGPYSFAVTSGSLPDDLALDPDTGEVSGTPSAAGTFNFTVTATDANEATAARAFTVVIAAAPSAGGGAWVFLS